MLDCLTVTIIFPFWTKKVGITLRSASPDSPQLPVLILKNLHSSEGGGIAWTSYDTGLVEGPFRPEHVGRLALTHSLAVTGKVLVAALEMYPGFAKGLQHIKVRALCLRLIAVAPRGGGYRNRCAVLN